ncbi:hypothetical protein ACEE23_00535 [Corynebacterium sp. 32222D000AT]|uniref:hypothetical protein n=1 Tax=unclassified Corynebacterium TaxID=2624378 RepID=UPI002A9304FB|nr:hypothetical protein [Mycobacteriaceae bacterium]MDY5829481.1 hypothetical protein [Corynebacterium sp.]
MSCSWDKCQHDLNKRWSQLSSAEQKGVIGALVLDGVLKATAWHYLYHLPSRKIRGPKWLWAIITAVIGTFGPAGFLLGGIRRR